MMKSLHICFFFIFFLIFGSIFGSKDSLAQPLDSVDLTLLHTNDVHSHYQVEKGDFELGGIARLATALFQERAKQSNTLVLDGGDWSEGSMYYHLDAGRTSFEILDALGYDAIVIGNHDWLNGPDQLLKLHTNFKHHFASLAANLNTSSYAREKEFNEHVQPYKIFTFGRLRVAVIGLVTFEGIYDKYLRPISIRDPFSVTRKLSNDLKEKKIADLVVVISHNSLATNRLIAGLPSVDVVVHAHDHQKLSSPIIIDRNGKQSFIVEAKCWGAYLGRLDLSYNFSEKKLTLAGYKLIQIDASIKNDQRIESMIEDYNHKLRQIYGNIFDDKVAYSKIDLRRDSSESLYGNLLTDAYREATHADISFEHMSLTSGQLYSGVLNTFEIYNALSAVFNPVTQRSWTLTQMQIRGQSLALLMNLILGLSSFIPGGGLISVSGLDVVYDPIKSTGTIAITNPNKNNLLTSISVNGEKLDPDHYYSVVMPQGIRESLEYIENYFGIKIDKRNEVLTDIEDWRALKSFLEKHSPIDSQTISRGHRISTLEPDLALYDDEIKWEKKSGKFFFEVLVRNLGASDFDPIKTDITKRLVTQYDRTPLDSADDPLFSSEHYSIEIPFIPAHGKKVLRFSLDEKFFSKNFKSKMKLPVYFRILGHGSLFEAKDRDFNTSNDATWIFIRL